VGEKLVEKARIDKNPKRVDVINRRKVRFTLTFMVVFHMENCHPDYSGLRKS